VWAAGVSSTNNQGHSPTVRTLIPVKGYCYKISIVNAILQFFIDAQKVFIHVCYSFENHNETYAYKVSRGF